MADEPNVSGLRLSLCGGGLEVDPLASESVKINRSNKLYLATNTITLVMILINNVM